MRRVHVRGAFGRGICLRARMAQRGYKSQSVSRVQPSNSAASPFSHADVAPPHASRTSGLFLPHSLL